MADYKSLIDRIVGDTFANRLGGLTVALTIVYQLSDGTYDAETDTTNPVTSILTLPNVVKTKATFEDVRDRGAVLGTAKYILPGQGITRDFNVEVDRVVEGGTIVNDTVVGGTSLNIAKVVGVPGDFVWQVYTSR